MILYQCLKWLNIFQKSMDTEKFIHKFKNSSEIII